MFEAQTVTTLVLTVAATLTACGLTAAYMVRSRKLEPPSERGMHTVPVPSGAGVAIVATALILWPLAQRFALSSVDVLLLATFACLAGISWLDDRHQLSPAIRLGAHVLAVALLLSALGSDERIIPALPLLLERLALGVAWVWFINLFNFMDGIDGIAGSEAIAVAAGYVAVAASAGTLGPTSALALVLAGACAGYLVWNWYPARVFMGDAGSISLGLLLGWLLIDLAVNGHWAAALILPGTFAADATLTLISRLRRGLKPWQPHREHFYQRAVLGGATPPQVVLWTSAANAALVVLAVASTRAPLTALAIAAAVVAALLVYLQHLAGKEGAQAVHSTSSAM